MKKIFFIINMIIIILLAGAIVSNAETTGTVNFTAATTEVTPGSEFAVVLNFKFNNEIGGISTFYKCPSNVEFLGGKLLKGEFVDLSEADREIGLFSSGDNQKELEYELKFKLDDDAEVGSTIKIETEEILVDDYYNEITIPATSITLNVVEKTSDGETSKKLSSIKITKNPTKTTYTEGEKFDPEGMEVKAVYDDNTEQEITNYTVSPSGNLSKEDKSVEISYTEGGITKTTTVSITVNEGTGTQTTNKLSSIKITTKPTKTTYTEGEKFSSSGMVVKAVYEDGTEKVITNYTVSPSGTLSTSNTTIKISYTEDGVTKTTTLNITVKAKQSTSGQKDNTTTSNKIPAAGKEGFAIVIAIVIAILGISCFVKYKQYRGIK